MVIRYLLSLLAILLLSPFGMFAQGISLDASFGNNGFISHTYDPDFFPFSMEVYPDGSVAIGAEDGDFGSPGFFALRLLPDGTIDNSFGSNGYVYFGSGNDYDYAYINDMEILGDETLVFVMTNSYHDYDWDHSDLMTMGINTAGSFSFFKANDLYGQSDDTFYAIEAFDGDKFRLSGSIYIPDFISWYDIDEYYLRVNAFSSSGSTVSGGAEYWMSEDRAYHTADLPGSDFLIAGWFNGKGAVVRNNSFGGYDSSFGNAGLAIESPKIIRQVWLLADGTIMAHEYGPPHKLYKLLSDGSPDLSFGNAGELVVPFASYANEEIGFLSDGRFIYAAGDKIYMHLPNGQPDSSFASNGVFTMDYNGSPFQVADFDLIGDTQFTVYRYNYSTSTLIVGRYFLGCTYVVTPQVQAVTPGTSNGSIFLDVSDPSGDLQYSIDNGVTLQSDPLFEGLTEGTYQLFVTNGSDCSWSQSFEMPVCALQAEIASFPSQGLLPTGKLLIEAQAGFGDLQYSIDGGLTFQSSPWFTGLPIGTYEISVMDSYGCVWNGMEEVKKLTVIAQVEGGIVVQRESTGLEILLHPNPVSDYLYISVNGGQGNLRFEIYDALGRVQHTANWNLQGDPFRVEYDLSNLPAGVYYWHFAGEGILEEGQIIKE